MKFKLITKKTIPTEEGQKLWKARKSRRRILWILIVVIILMFLMILRPSVIRKKHLRTYGAEIGNQGLHPSFPPIHMPLFFSMKKFPCSGYIFPVSEILL
jgi:hypothetical protein